MADLQLRSAKSPSGRWGGSRRRLALQNAASVAGLLLTTEVMVAEAPKDEEHKHPMPDMGGMGDMGM